MNAAPVVGLAGADSDVEAFVAAHARATPFHSARWGRAIETAAGHRWHPLVARNPAGTIIGLLPLHHIRSRLFGSALISSGFAVGGGILADDEATAEALATAARDLATSLGLSSIELRGGTMPNGWAVVRDSHLGFERPLAATDEEELAAVPRKHRAEVRKGLAAPLSVTVGRDRRARDAHYTVYAESVRNLGTPVFPRRLFDAVLDAFGDDADILTVTQDGAPQSSVLSLYWRGSVMPYWGGGTRDARSLRANERMYFALMGHARECGMARFDFGRSKTGSGPAAYKKNWGFEGVPLAYAHWSANGAVRDMNPTSAKYRLMVNGWQRLPLWLANRVGPVIARQLG